MIRLCRFRFQTARIGFVCLALAALSLLAPPPAKAQEGRQDYRMGQGEGMSGGRGEGGGVQMSVQPRPQAPQNQGNVPMNIYPQVYTGGQGGQGSQGGYSGQYQGQYPQGRYQGQYQGQYQGGYQQPGYQPQPGQGGPPVLYVPPDPNDPNSRPRLEYPRGYQPGSNQADQPYLYAPPRQGDPDARPRLEPPVAAPRERRR